MTTVVPLPFLFNNNHHDESSLDMEERGRAEKCSTPPSPPGDALGRSFLTFLRDPDLQKQYQSSQRKHFDSYTVTPLFLITYVAVATRSNLSKIVTENMWFQASFAFILLFSLLFVPYVLLRMIVYYTPVEKQLRSSYKRSKVWLRICYQMRIEDVLGILAQMSAGLCLLGRVYAGQCSSPINVWSSQSCNTVADMNSIPGDQVIFLYVLPLGTQCVLRGISIYSLVASCILSMLFVILASVHVGSLVEAWTILYSIAFLTIMLMVERLMFATFMQGQLMLVAVKLNAKHELELLALSRDNERKLKESEICQLRSLLGNAAHDLKTPLHSIEADLDVLNSFMSGIPKSVLQNARETFQINGAGVSFDLQSIFGSLTATCKFMAMAINRSQDFMKASNNIALIPMMETFDLESAVAISVTCIHHVQSTRIITVHPIDSSICSNLISDKHWLSENVLCLLSNALKYSDDGAVDLRISLIDAPTRGSPPLLTDSLGLMAVSKNKGKCKKVEVSRRLASVVELRQPLSHVDSKAGQRSLTHLTSIDTESLESSFETKSMILVSVEDTGIGIAEEARQNLFQSFKQAQRMAGGTGLGLYSLSKRVEALGGTNGVSSRSDGKQGSVFWFTFPYRPDETATLDAASTHGSLRIQNQQIKIYSGSTPIKKRSILVVDDSISILKVTSRLLKMSGHEVETAANGFIGLKILQDAFVSQKFDMVLSDLQMPVMDGIEATRRYREYEEEEMRRESRDDALNRTSERKRLLIVGMSANSDDQSKQQALDSGMDYFIPKPFSYQDLRPILYDIQMKIDSSPSSGISTQDPSNILDSQKSSKMAVKRT